MNASRNITYPVYDQCFCSNVLYKKVSAINLGHIIIVGLHHICYMSTCVPFN